MKEIILISRHAFSARNHNLFAVTKPEAIDHKGIIPVCSDPQHIGISRTGEKTVGAVDIMNNNSENKANQDNRNRSFCNKHFGLAILRFFYQPQLHCFFVYIGRIIVHHGEGILSYFRYDDECEQNKKTMSSIAQTKFSPPRIKRLRVIH